MIKDHSEEMKEINRKLSLLEQHVINLIIPIQDICKIFKDTNRLNGLVDLLSKPLKVDTRQLESSSAQIRESSNSFKEDIKDLDIKRTFDEIKYIGKRLNDIEVTLSKIKEEGVSKNVQLDFTVDGYQMVKKPLDYRKDDLIEDPNKNLVELLDTLSEREKKVLIYRIGLFGEEKKTLKQVGEIFGITGEPVRQCYNKAIRKLRHPSKKKMLDKVSNPKLKKEIFGC